MDNQSGTIALSCEAFREMDRLATEEFHIPIEFLMENAGRTVAEEILKLTESKKVCGGTVLIICGSGHNGGDGMVCARFLQQSLVPVKVIFVKDPQSFKGASLNQFEKLKEKKIPHLILPDRETFIKEIEQSVLIIDAILGTGAQGVVSPSLSSIISLINRSKKYIVAVDIPSGLDPDTGEKKGDCIEANLTVTFAAAKKGFLNPAAKRWTGEIFIRDIGFPKTLLERFKANHSVGSSL